MKEKEPPIIIARPSEGIPKVTSEKLVELVQERAENTGHSLISSLSIISNEIEIEGETIQERAENKARLLREAAKILKINWPESQPENSEKPTVYPSPEKKQPKEELPSTPSLAKWAGDAGLRSRSHPPDASFERE